MTASKMRICLVPSCWGFPLLFYYYSLVDHGKGGNCFFFLKHGKQKSLFPFLNYHLLVNTSASFQRFIPKLVPYLVLDFSHTRTSYFSFPLYSCMDIYITTWLFIFSYAFCFHYFFFKLLWDFISWTRSYKCYWGINQNKLHKEQGLSSAKIFFSALHTQSFSS